METFQGQQKSIYETILLCKMQKNCTKNVPICSNLQ